MNHDIRRKGRTSQSATIAAASILELHLFTRSAQAQEATGDVSAFQDIASVDGVASVETLDDGSVELTMEDGSVLTVPAGEVQILNGTVFVSDSFLIAQGLTASSNNTVLLLALGAAGVAVAANALESSSDSDDDVVPPVATPPPPPMLPVFTSSASADVAENQTDAYRAVATDADSDTLSYSLSGTDASRFMIDSATGEVRFIEAPDFEAPGDADADNVYDIVVTASDGANTAERTVAIMVTDENEAPVFTSDAAVSVAENQTVAYTALATDADGDDLSYNLSGTDAALFMIDATTGEVRFIEAPDFEAPGDADGDNIYDIVVTASDGTNSTDQTVAITVTDENDPPIFTSDAAVSEAENQAVAYTALATDADGDDLSYTLSGTDAARFMIDAATGEVRFIEAPDFEAPGDADGDNVYDIVVTASDGTNSTDQTVAITVTDENEAPVFTSDAAVSVAENQAVAYTALATDADGDDLSYNLSGTDAALFMIDATTGEVSFIEAPDFEAPGDADGDNIYDIVVTASDGTISTDQTVAITVTNENDNAPSFTSDAAVSVAENQIAAYTALATDADGDDLSYNLSGTDAALFMIDGATGEVRFIEAPDFEAPGDADGDNVYDIVVTASDGTNSADQAVAITVTDENDSPIFTSDAAVSVADNQAVAYTALATDADGDDLSYNLSGTDAALFMIDATTGEVRFIEAPDFENPRDADGDNVYDIVVTASDGTNSADQAVAITVTDENDSPIFTSDAAVSVAENQTVAYTALATDADGDDLSYNLSGTDAALFMIDGATGEVRFIEAPDFENPGDADGDNVYDIVVTASDGTNSTDQTVAITVTNENDNAPSFTSDAAVSVDENQTVDSVLYTAMATDADGDALSYSLSGTDAALFTIDAATGEVRFIEAPDFEAPGDADGDNVYDIVVTASDGTSSTDQAVAITVTDGTDSAAFARLLDDPEEASVADFDAAGIERVNTLTLNAVRELLQAIGENDPATLASLTPQQVQAITDIARDHIVSISGPEEAGLYDSGEFTLGSNPVIVSVEAGSFIVALDYDGDGETDHIVNIEFDADYRVQRVERDFGADNAPDDSPDVVEVVEHLDERTIRITYDIRGDGDTDRIETYTLDANGDRIRIDVDTDADGSTDRAESYEVDAGGNRIQVDFDDAADGTIERTEFDADADGTADRIEHYTYNAAGDLIRTDFDDAADGTIERTEFDADADGTPDRIEHHTYNASGNRIQTDFDDAADGDIDRVEIYTLDENGNRVRTDFDDNNDGIIDRIESYTLDASGNRVRTDFDDNADGTINRAEFDDDADGTADRSEIYIYDASGNRVRTDFDDNNDGTIDRVEFHDSTPTDNTPIDTTPTDTTPVFTSAAAVSVAENQTAAYTAVATDADGDALSYSLSGTDAALFTINPATGAVSFIAPPDFETPGDAGGDNVYDIVVTASDGTRSAEQAVAITVTNVNDNTPSLTSPDSADVEENQRLAYTAQAADADGDDLSYSLSGTDAALFTIDPNTGAVSFIEAPDFEEPGDAGGDNVYDIVVTASDGTRSAEQAVVITVTNVNDNIPSFTSSGSADVEENQRLAYTTIAADADGDALSYSLSGTDAALFTIDPNTGVVSFMEAPDFEAPGDAGGDNVYDIVVTASDGTNSNDQTVAITVTNVNEVGNAPIFTSDASAAVAENQTAAYTAVATEADGDPLSYSLSGTDAALFTIDPTTGAVSFIAPPDFENPGDADRDNVYDIVVTASDGPNRTNQPVAITVTNVNDNTPSFTSADLGRRGGEPARG